MPHPKRKISKSRRDKRRSQDKAAIPTVTSCSNCAAPIKMHRVCPECGYYKGKLAIAKEVAV